VYSCVDWLPWSVASPSRAQITARPTYANNARLYIRDLHRHISSSPYLLFTLVPSPENFFVLPSFLTLIFSFIVSVVLVTFYRFLFL